MKIKNDIFKIQKGPYINIMGVKLMLIEWISIFNGYSSKQI